VCVPVSEKRILNVIFFKNIFLRSNQQLLYLCKCTQNLDNRIFLQGPFCQKRTHSIGESITENRKFAGLMLVQTRKRNPH